MAWSAMTRREGRALHPGEPQNRGREAGGAEARAAAARGIVRRTMTNHDEIHIDIDTLFHMISYDFNMIS